MDTPQLAQLPTPLTPLGAPTGATSDGTTLRMKAGPATDWFVDPNGTGVVDNAPYLWFQPPGDFMLACRVSLEFRATFDAGVLAVHAGPHTWAKLCFEYTPHAEPSVVSVVTRGLSDDANAWTVDGTSVFLRISRIDEAFAFHSSIDGKDWSLVRYFTIDGAATARVGFLAQAPTGDGCLVTFDDIHFEAERLNDIRDGT